MATDFENGSDFFHRVDLDLLKYEARLVWDVEADMKRWVQAFRRRLLKKKKDKRIGSYS